MITVHNEQYCRGTVYMSSIIFFAD